MFWLTRSVNLGNRVRDRNILRWIATNHCSSLNNSTFSIIKHHIFYAATNDLSAELFHHFHASTQEAMEEFVLFDFTKLPNLHGWSEMSDVVREVGMSKAVLVLQKTQRFQRGVLFTMLNPQPNGAGFAGFRTDTELDLSDYNTLRLHCRGQGENYGYKVVLRHKNENTEPFPSYEQMFQAPNRKFETVDLPLAGFEPYYRGKKQNQSAPLDKSQITNFEFQIYGGVYLPVKQAGTSSLEIDWVKAVP